MMHLDRALAGLDDQADVGAQACADQVVMHRRGGQQCRDRERSGDRTAVGQDQDVEPSRTASSAALAQRIRAPVAMPDSALGHPGR